MSYLLVLHCPRRAEGQVFYVEQSCRNPTRFSRNITLFHEYQFDKDPKFTNATLRSIRQFGVLNVLHTRPFIVQPIGTASNIFVQKREFIGWCLYCVFGRMQGKRIWHIIKKQLQVIRVWESSIKGEFSRGLKRFFCPLMANIFVATLL